MNTTDASVAEERHRGRRTEPRRGDHRRRDRPARARRLRPPDDGGRRQRAGRRQGHRLPALGSKAELVIDAMATSSRRSTPSTPARSTATSSHDRRVVRPTLPAAAAGDVSICSALPREPELLETFAPRFTEPRIAPHRRDAASSARRAAAGADVNMAIAASLGAVADAPAAHDRPARRARLRRADRRQRPAPGACDPPTARPTPTTATEQPHD